MEAALKASGLTSPLPGLIDLYEEGTFFPCAPYGTCWQPNEAAPVAELSQQATPATASPLDASSAEHPGQSPHQPVPPRKQTLLLPDCLAGWSILQPYDWPLCHDGYWLHVDHGRFVFLLGKKPHHHPPICWVKVGNVKGYVPRHPDDVKGQPPKNLKYGVLVPPHTPGATPTRVSIKAAGKVEVLDRAPREFQRGSSGLTRVDHPQIQSRLTGLDPQGNSVPVRYDYNRQVFTLDASSEHGASSRPVVVAGLNSHGVAFGHVPPDSRGRNSDGYTSGSRTNGGGGATAYNGGAGGNHTYSGGGGGRSSDGGGSRSSDSGASHSAGSSSGVGGGGGGDRGRP